MNRLAEKFNTLHLAIGILAVLIPGVFWLADVSHTAEAAALESVRVRESSMVLTDAVVELKIQIARNQTVLQAIADDIADLKTQQNSARIRAR